MGTDDLTGRPQQSSTSSGYDRIIAVLGELATERHANGWGVRELAETLAESRSGINRILFALADVDLAERTDAGNYRVGPRLRVLADRLLTQHPLMAAAPGIMTELSLRTKATAIIAIHDWPSPRSFVAIYQGGEGPVRYALDPGTTLPLHAGAAGQAILSQIGTRALDTELATFTADTVVDAVQLAEMVDRTRDRGFALSIGQHFPLAAGVAVSLRLAGLVAAISVTRPRYNTNVDDLIGFAPLLAQARDELISSVARNAVVESQSVGSTASRDVSHSPASGPAPSRLERLLAALSGDPAGLPSGGRQLGRAIGANRATAVKLIDSAAQSGLAVTLGDRYVPGPRLLRWAASLGRISERTDVLATIAQAATTEVGEAVGLAEYHPDRGTATMSFVATGATPLRYGLATGVNMPLHAGAAGKAILAHLPESILDTLTLEPFTDRTITSKAILAEQLSAIRARGWAVGDGERIPDAFGIAVPYFIDGTVAGSITATMPRFRATEVDTERIAAALTRSAEHITRLLSAVSTASEPAPTQNQNHA